MNASQAPVFSNPYAPGVSLGGPPERQASPQIPVNLGSNNPFRNRALSPSANSFSSSGRPERPTSTNPFLDDTDAISPQSAPTAPSGIMSPIDRQDLTGNTRDLFENLSLNGAAQTQTTGYRPAPPRPDIAFQKAPPSNRPPPQRRGEKNGLDVFADPAGLSKATSSAGNRPRETRDREKERRPQRRNSESSIMERPKLLDPEDERRRRERRRREREGRHKDGKSKSKKGHYHMDIIDKLDVTSIYGTGMFHHDGPFDACNPNRNRKGVRTAPMQAFPKDSTSMALGGAGPVNKNIDLNLFNGTMTEGYNDYATSATGGKPDTAVSFDPTARIDPVHGSESMGLGTSTFLDGAPASRSAMQRRVSENEGQPGGGGLQRKKSLAQRLRGMNRPPPGRMISPEPSTPNQVSSSYSGSSRPNEKNPFFQDYDDAWDKKGARIDASETTGRARSASSPKQRTGIERKLTEERTYNGFDEAKPNAAGGGFLNRMKSLRKPKPERRVSED